jgi:hypothetical protein
VFVLLDQDEGDEEAVVVPKRRNNQRVSLLDKLESLSKQQERQKLNR